MFTTAALIAVTAAAADLTARALCHLTSFQDCDSKPDSSFPAAAPLDSLDSGGLWQPIKTQTGAQYDDTSGRFDRSNSLDGNSSDGFGFNALDGNGLYESMSPDSLYGSSSPTDSILEAMSIPPPALTRTASQPTPHTDSYLYSPFKTGAASASAPHSERKPPRPPGSSAWAESFRDMDGRERQKDVMAGVSQREPAPMWLSRNDSASSGSSYGAGSRPMSYGSFGDGDGADDDSQMNLQSSRPPAQPTRPLSGRRALPLASFSPKGKFQEEPATAARVEPIMFPAQHESEHDRRPIPAPRPPASSAAAAATSSSSAANEQVTIARMRWRFCVRLTPLQRAWSASAALAGSSDNDIGDRAGTGAQALTLDPKLFPVHNLRCRAAAAASRILALQRCLSPRY
jgi:hypothetical protein